MFSFRVEATFNDYEDNLLILGGSLFQIETDYSPIELFILK